MSEIGINRKNLEQRAKLLSKADADTDFRRQVYTACTENIEFWINNFVWTYDPRRRGSRIIPFTMFQKQQEYIQWRIGIANQEENGLIEKSRDMGVSWLNVCHQAHQFIFLEGFKGTFGSRKSDFVDRLGDMDSLLEKVRFILKRLPAWMRPQNYTAGYMKIINHENGSTITGESGDETGRGGRATIYDYDEFAFVNRAEKAEAGISQNANVIFYTSTPNGPGNLFYRKRMAGNISVFTFNYWEHPGKNEQWLEQQEKKYDKVLVAREILIDYLASVENVTIDGSHVKAAIELYLPTSGPRIAGLDVAAGGAAKNVFIYRNGPNIRFIESWEEGTTFQTAHKTKMLCEQHEIYQLNYDANGVGAGVTGDLRAMADDRKLNFLVGGVMSGGAASDTIYPEFDDRQGRDIFADLRSEVWWLLRRRFERTYEYVKGIALYEPEELISIPNHPQLIVELSTPKWGFNSRGLIKIESKKDMSSRGIKSPDYADALMMSEANMIETYDPWW